MLAAALRPWFWKILCSARKVDFLSQMLQRRGELPTALIEAEGLGKQFGAIAALNGLSLSIPAGGVYGVLGANGAGKSTFFRLVPGFVASQLPADSCACWARRRVILNAFAASAR